MVVRGRILCCKGEDMVVKGEDMVVRGRILYCKGEDMVVWGGYGGQG